MSTREFVFESIFAILKETCPGEPLKVLYNEDGFKINFRHFEAVFGTDEDRAFWVQFSVDKQFFTVYFPLVSTFRKTMAHVYAIQDDKDTLVTTLKT